MFIISAAFGFGMGLLALRFQRAFAPTFRSRLQWHLHCIGKELSGQFFIIRAMATLGLRFAAQWLHLNGRRLWNA
jgi:hypothetical protein